MSHFTIYHNPRCSKSRQTLALLEENNCKIQVIEYLNTYPSVSELKVICKKLGIKPIELFRTKEALFKELGLNTKDEKSDIEWLEILQAHPKLIERPIVVKSEKAVIGRPPENVLGLIG